MAKLNSGWALVYAHCKRCENVRLGFLWCHRCDTAKPPWAFYRDHKRGTDAYHSGCKACRRSYWIGKRQPKKPRACVLTEKQLAEIRAIWVPGTDSRDGTGRSSQELSLKYGVSNSYLRRVVRECTTSSSGS